MRTLRLPARHSPAPEARLKSISPLAIHMKKRAAWAIHAALSEVVKVVFIYFSFSIHHAMPVGKRVKKNISSQPPGPHCRRKSSMMFIWTSSVLRALTAWVSRMSPQTKESAAASMVMLLTMSVGNRGTLPVAK